LRECIKILLECVVMILVDLSWGFYAYIFNIAILVRFQKVV